MYLCFLCKGNTKESYNICTTTVFDNSKLLLALLQEVTNNDSMHRTGDEICGNCYQLFNELYEYQKKVKEISEKLHLYLTESSDVIADGSVIIKNETLTDFKESEETEKIHHKCHVCFKLFLSKGGVTRHLNKQHSLVISNDVKSSFTEVKVQTNTSNTAEESVLKKTKRKISENPKVYQCTFCPKKWKTPGELKNHLYSHSSIKPYICEICGQAYKHKPALDVHVGMHNGINPFMCVYCKKSFTQKGALRRHLPIHTGKLFNF